RRRWQGFGRKIELEVEVAGETGAIQHAAAHQSAQTKLCELGHGEPARLHLPRRPRSKRAACQWRWLVRIARTGRSRDRILAGTCRRSELRAERSITSCQDERIHR